MQKELTAEKREQELQWYRDQKLDELMGCQAEEIASTWSGDGDDFRRGVMEAFEASGTIRSANIIRSMKDGVEVKPGYMTQDLYEWEGRSVVFVFGQPDGFRFRKGDFETQTAEYRGELEELTALEVKINREYNSGRYKDLIDFFTVKENEQMRAEWTALYDKLKYVNPGAPYGDRIMRTAWTKFCHDNAIIVTYSFSDVCA